MISPDFSVNSVIYQIDTATLEAKPLNDEVFPGTSNVNDISIVGKYLLTGSKEYDLEANEVIAEPLGIGESYFGGLFSLETGLRCVKAVQTACDASVNKRELESFDELSTLDDILNHEYYIYRDSYGCFLRKLGEGETTEEVMYLDQD